MQKILAITLSFIVLFQSFTIDFNDFSKIDDLVEHAQVHFEQGESIFEFISKHYGEELTNHKNEHQKHQNLPFKHKKIDAQVQLVLCLNQSNFEFRISSFEIVSNNFEYNEHRLSLPELEFFQPPKIM